MMTGTRGDFRFGARRGEYLTYNRFVLRRKTRRVRVDSLFFRLTNQIPDDHRVARN